MLLDRATAIDLYSEIVKKTQGQRMLADKIERFSEKIIGKTWDEASDVERANLMANLYMAYSDILSQ